MAHLRLVPLLLVMHLLTLWLLVTVITLIAKRSTPMAQCAMMCVVVLCLLLLPYSVMLSVNLLGALLWLMSSLSFVRLALGFSCLVLLVTTLLGANGCLKQSTSLMVLLRRTRLAWLPVVLLNTMVWIMVKLSVLSSSHATVRLVLSLVVSRGWVLCQVDVSNAFLHGYLQEDVYMQQPPGFEDARFPSHVCKLQRALYGLKQSPRAWYARLSSRLYQLGFTSSKADTSLFVFSQAPVYIRMLMYVDDIVIASSSSAAVDKLVQALSDTFPIKDLGPLEYFLGLEASRNSGGMMLTQRKYALDLLHKVGMYNCKSTSTPLVTTERLSRDTGASLGTEYSFRYHSIVGGPQYLTLTPPDISFARDTSASLGTEYSFRYHSIVGGPQYLTLTRPDISFAVNKLCQFLSQPTKVHWEVVKRILRYVKGTLDTGLKFCKSSAMGISIFTDADWAGDVDDRRSGYAIFVGPNLVSWSSKKQPTISRSSTEVEYKALANGAAEAMWV
ncbi:hypothetical protein QYE76_001233 [Lolium multiflorum]|uniref:Reverse transcriptase Ty1/copia-type domain-containing protein n=1 Tax=Lolium multiflorum TaxID=4521 RepID=A0AAD8RKW0_LOLMU|nr:hypothetical protein QYE76_001233 [Lolium multiflorum]